MWLVTARLPLEEHKGDATPRIITNLYQFMCVTEADPELE